MRTDIYISIYQFFISSLLPRIDVAGMTDTRIDVLASEDHANVPMTPLGVVPTG